jgi:hypothetical protein
MDIDTVRVILDRLIGLPLWSAGRAGDLEWFHFGSQHNIIDESGTTGRPVGDYALHVQCAWRIIGPVGILVGSDDLYFPATGETSNDSAEFDWDRKGKNRRDEMILALIESREGESLIVTDVGVDHVGNIRLTLSHLYVFEVFPYSSLPREQWRLFQPHNDTRHLVLTGRGFLD